MLGRYFVQTRGIFPLVFLTFLPPLPGHLPTCPLASLGKIRPWERSLGLADIVAQGFGHGWKIARKERRISPKRGALPPTGVCPPLQGWISYTAPEGGRAPRAGRTTRRGEGVVTDAWERKIPAAVCREKSCKKGERSPTLASAGLGSPQRMVVFSPS